MKHSRKTMFLLVEMHINMVWTFEKVRNQDIQDFLAAPQT
jgi:hypothetical protein